MEIKFTRAMMCEEFGTKCRQCPCYTTNTDRPCWMLAEDEITAIMKDYPYYDVKVRMMFKTHEELEAKHEADCRLISEYDLEVKNLRKTNDNQIETISDLYSELCTEQKERIRCESVIEWKNEAISKIVSDAEKYKEDSERVRDKYKRQGAILNKKYDEIKELEERLELSNRCNEVIKEEKKALEQKLKERERDLEKNAETLTLAYASAGEKSRKIEKLIKENELLTESNNNHATDNIELEGKLEEKSLRIAALEAKIRNQRANLSSLQEKYEEALKFNKAREDVYYQNQKLTDIIKAKDREIATLRSKLSTIEDYDDYDGLD